MWVVRIVKRPVRDDFRNDFFPRRVYYKKDTLELVKEVEQKGGEAVAEKETTEG